MGDVRAALREAHEEQLQKLSDETQQRAREGGGT